MTMAPSGHGRSIAVVGGGTMGVGIAYVFAAAGFKVWLVEPDDARAAVVGRILSEVAVAGVKRGKLDEARRQWVVDAVQRRVAVRELPEALDLVVETVPERLPLKHRVLAEIAARRPKLVATNTSAISIDELSQSVGDASIFLGMHFFNPVWSLPMVELVRGMRTSEAALTRAREFAEATGKTTITVRDVPGFATSRLDLIASLEAIRMLQDGVASASDIDHAMVTAYRHPIGPLRLSDVVGLDVRLDIARHLHSTLGDRYAPPQLLQDLVAQGHLGQKTGKGFFDWPRAEAR